MVREIVCVSLGAASSDTEIYKPFGVIRFAEMGLVQNVLGDAAKTAILSGG